MVDGVCVKHMGPADQTQAPKDELVFEIVRASWQELSGARKVTHEVDGRLSFFL